MNFASPIIASIDTNWFAPNNAEIIAEMFLTLPILRERLLNNNKQLY